MTPAEPPSGRPEAPSGGSFVSAYEARIARGSSQAGSPASPDPKPRPHLIGRGEAALALIAVFLLAAAALPVRPAAEPAPVVERQRIVEVEVGPPQWSERPSWVGFFAFYGLEDRLREASMERYAERDDSGATLRPEDPVPTPVPVSLSR